MRFDERLDAKDSLILIVLLILCVYYFQAPEDKELADNKGRPSLSNIIFYLLLSLGMLIYGSTYFINGATQIRAVVMRPEIFIGSTDKSIVEDSFDEDKLAISIGSKVRIIREPFFGLIGEVIELPKELVTIDTETTSRVAKIKLNNDSCEIIPRANLEVILLD